MLVMRATDTLFKSLRPGKITRKGYRRGHKNQVVRFKKSGEVVLGTNVPYAKMAEGKGESHRKLWPDDLGIWYDRAVAKGRDAIADTIKKINNAS